MAHTIRLAAIALSLLGLVGCSSAPEPTKTPLELQALQSRDFENSKEVVFASVVSVFQDLGYSVSNADYSTGLISAESATQSNDAVKFWFGSSSRKQTKATAFVEQIGQVTRVRLNFVEVHQTSSAYGMDDRSDIPLLDQRLYQNAFDRIETAAFVRSAS